MDKICSFFGHKKVEEREELREKIFAQVEKLLESGVTVFLFGGFGEFDELCYKVVSLLKVTHPNLKRVYCLTDERHLLERKRPKYLRAEDYEEFIYLTPEFSGWYKRIYYRNCAMIEKSDFVIFYAENREESGAYKALKYAVSKKKEYINLFFSKQIINSTI